MIRSAATEEEMKNTVTNWLKHAKVMLDRETNKLYEIIK